MSNTTWGAIGVIVAVQLVLQVTALVQLVKTPSERVTLGGRKWLYAHTYYQADEFWQMYGGRAWYDELRTKYRATTLPSVWDKVYVDPEGAGGKKRHWLKSKSPIGGFWGIYQSIKSKDYMLHRKAGWKWKGEQ